MKKTIFFKTFFNYLVIIIGLISLVLFFSFKTIRPHYINTLVGDLKDLSETLGHQAIPYIHKGNFYDLDKLIKGINIDTQKRITIISVDGIVLADSKSDPSLMENHSKRPEVVKVLKGVAGTSLRYSSTVMEKMLYVATPIIDRGETIGIMRTSLYLKDIDELIGRLRRKIIGISAVILFAALIAAFFFARGVSIPVKKLKYAAHNIGTGNFNTKVFLKSEDELNDLAKSFNYMTDKVNELFSALSQKKDELTTVINSIPESMFVIDEKDKIKLSNESFKKLFNDNLVDNKYYWEIVRVEGFKALVEKAKEKKICCFDEIDLSGITYRCSVSPVLSSNESVVVLHDITQTKNLEKRKKDFVANVSHELRTPLTAIKGFVETIEESSEDAGRYLEIIKRHTERMINIVEDLLVLSQMEEEGFKLDIINVDLKVIVGDTLKLFEPALHDSKVNCRVEVQSNMQMIKADPFMLEQMFINLMANAVKYTERGEILVSLKQAVNETVITVSDTGIGIPEKNMPFIFERFYVVDKSRSRKSGGTGLGLSIVKHIVLLHNGNISADSVPGAGSKFTITLPFMQI